MVKAGLLNIPARGRIVITQLGRDFLASKPKALNTKMLFQYPSFAAFQRKEQPEKSEPQSFIAQTQTLDEQLEELYQQHRRGLREEILERIYKVPPTFFERLVIDVLVAMGYGGSVQDAGKAVGKSGDGGIDGIIKQDRLGLENIYIQAKRWQDNVGRPTVNEFAGSLALRKASKGVLITTSDFTDQARVAAATHGNIVLVTGSQLADFMMDYGVGVSTVAQHQIKKVDLDYFEDI